MTEAKRKRGRPATGQNPKVATTIPVDVLARVDQSAANRFEGRPDALRRLIEVGLDHDE